MNLEITNKENPFDDFKRIASSLMNDNVLLVGENYYRFTSLEFYYFEKDSHADVYSHQHENQMTSEQWYFHGSGLDITFGSKDVYGGILIRGVKNLKENKFINGPILCVQELFKNLGAVNNSEKMSFYIQKLPWDRMGSLIEEQKVYYSRRVGLNPKIDQSEKARFYNGLYRFFINPKETQKDKSNIAVDLLTQVGSEKEINDLFGYKHFK
ncbi:hypothetical protein [Mucilaginibacter sp.]|uniref:hypothetical protein n=1 Tax=Mucilaginibacter sp. TaxID=1882438 RepID=UPI00284ADAAA|nr:hypothetical protein [Mucilaginibacter sp.]MDR3695160.1 hypothetical protein [Mucilaginibacter sp.]